MGRFAYREIETKTSKAAALDDGIETINLEGLDYISQLDIQAACLCAEGTDMGTPIWKVISKIEILGNGSSVIKSYNPAHLKAIAAYSGVDMTSHGNILKDGGTDTEFFRFPILFGRYPGDPKYMLNTDAWESLKAKITWNAATVTHDGQTYEASASPAFKYAADATVYEGGSPPGNAGYIKSMQINEYTMAASTRYPTEIPRGHPLRGITTRFAFQDDAWYYFYDSFKLNFDNGKWIPIDCIDRHLSGLITKWWPKPFNASQYADTDSATENDFQFGIITSLSHTTSSNVDQELALTSSPDFGLQVPIVTNATATATTAPTAWLLGIQGYLPMHCMYFPMWKFADVGEDAVSTDGYKRIDFEHTTDASAGAGTATICAEYLCPQGPV